MNATITLIDNTYATPTTYEITNIDLNSTVLKFNQEIQKQTGLSSSLLILTFNDVKIINPNTLTSYGITDGSIINNTSAIIFLTTAIDNITYNITGLALNKRVADLQFKGRVTYNIPLSNLFNLYFNNQLLDNLKVLSVVGIKYGSTVIAYSLQASLQAQQIQIPTPLPPIIPPNFSNEPLIKSPISQKFIPSLQANPIAIQPIYPSNTIRNILQPGLSTGLYYELISESPNLNIEEEQYALEPITDNTNKELKKVLISSKKIQPESVNNPGQSVSVYKYKTLTENPNKTLSTISNVIDTIEYKITNTNTTQPSPILVPQLPIQFKCNFGVIQPDNTVV